MLLLRLESAKIHIAYPSLSTLTRPGVSVHTVVFSADTTRLASLFADLCVGRDIRAKAEQHLSLFAESSSLGLFDNAFCGELDHTSLCGLCA